MNLRVNNTDSKLEKQQGDEVTNIYLSFTCAGRPPITYLRFSAMCRTCEAIKE